MKVCLCSVLLYIAQGHHFSASKRRNCSAEDFEFFIARLKSQLNLKGLKSFRLKSQLDGAVHIDTNQRQKSQMSQSKKRNIFIAIYINP